MQVVGEGVKGNAEQELQVLRGGLFGPSLGALGVAAEASRE